MRDRFFDADPLTGSQTFFSYDAVDDSFSLATATDVEAILDVNQALANDDAGRSDVRRIASIPMPIWGELQKSGVAGDPKKFARWLMDRDNLKFRTSGLRL